MRAALLERAARGRRLARCSPRRRRRDRRARAARRARPCQPGRRRDGGLADAPRAGPDLALDRHRSRASTPRAWPPTSCCGSRTTRPPSTPRRPEQRPRRFPRGSPTASASRLSSSPTAAAATRRSDRSSSSCPAGSTVALVGENGAGKTTLVKLLTGDVPAGRRADHGRRHRPGRARRSSAWRERVERRLPGLPAAAVHPRRERRARRHPADRGRTRRCATRSRRADATAIEQSLPDGLLTRVGTGFTGGRELSGGQWQRLALARGLMRDAPLLVVLDEPTASLDAPTESALFERYMQAARRAGGGAGHDHAAGLAPLLDRARRGPDRRARTRPDRRARHARAADGRERDLRRAVQAAGERLRLRAWRSASIPAVVMTVSSSRISTAS